MEIKGYVVTARVAARLQRNSLGAIERGRRGLILLVFGVGVDVCSDVRPNGTAMRYGSGDLQGPLPFTCFSNGSRNLSAPRCGSAIG
jgi:hypothetical protein